jgi:GAF domain
MPRGARVAKLAKAKVGAELAAARKSLENEAARRRQLEERLAEALDRETATGEILRVINNSPTSVEPVFEAILTNGIRLCQADVGLLFLVQGDVFRLVADRGAAREFVEPRRAGMRYGPHTGLARAALERRPVQINDMMADRAYTERDPTRLQTVELLGARTGVWVPMLKEDAPVGVLVT